MAHFIGECSLPKTCYSMYDIAKFEKISKDRMSQLMSDTLSRVKQFALGKSATGIEMYFNSSGVKDVFVNAFTTYYILRPFALGIKLTVEKC